MFTELLNRNKPLCSSLQTEQLQILFGNDTDKVNSNLLMRIKQSNWNGMFVLGSEERNQYGIGNESMPNIRYKNIKKTYLILGNFMFPVNYINI